MSKSNEIHAILQVLPELNTGGVERTTVDIAGAIARRKWRSLVACQGGQMLPELEQEGANHIELPLNTKNPIAIWQNSKKLKKIIEIEKVDLIHARSRAPAWSALMAANHCGIPFVTTYHGAYSQNSRLKSFYNSSMVRSDRIIANSHYTAELIARRHHFAKDRITVIHRGVDTKAFESGKIGQARVEALRIKWQIPENTRILFNSARLTKWKGQISIIDAFAELAMNFPEIHLVLAGSAQGRQAYEDEIRKRIGKCGLNGRVHVVGHCGDIPAAMKLADFAVVGSIEPEAFGRAAVEAQAAGIPCVATDIGAATETVLAPPQTAPGERTGWRVPPNDSKAMAESLKEAFSISGEELFALSERARAHVNGNFSLEMMERKTLSLYEQLLGTGS